MARKIGHTLLGDIGLPEAPPKNCSCPFCKFADGAYKIHPVDRTAAYKFDVYFGSLDPSTRRKLREIEDFVHVGNELFTLFFVKSGYLANDNDADYMERLIGAKWVKVECSPL